MPALSIPDIVRVFNADRGIAGSGLLVSEKRVLTPAQTVALALNISKPQAEMPGDELLLDLPRQTPGQFLRARVVYWQPALDATVEGEIGEDIAVLELLDELPKQLGHNEPPRSPSNKHYATVIDAICDGELIPFLGAGVNLCGRPSKTGWQRGVYLPSGQELAAFLAQEFSYPVEETLELVRVSQYAALMRGSEPLYRKLRYVFDADYPPTPLHDFLATLPSVLRAKKYPSCQLIVTTNYDDVLERAFRQQNEPFDLVTYVAGGGPEQRGKFLHWSFEGDVNLIDKPNEYRGLALDENRNLQRTVILKIHGAVDRITAKNERPRDSFVITEDHYIDYLTRSDISSLVPVTLAEKLKGSSFLFLGYSLRDWNLRVILHRIWMEQQQNMNYKSWAIQLYHEELEQEFWKKRDVEIFNARLEDYISELSRRVTTLPFAGG